MTERIVIGLFQSGGIALDAYHRLRTEGVPATRLAYKVLKEIAPIPAVTQPELEALEVDPLVLGDARHSFARFIRNGETAVFVHTMTDDEVELALDTLKLYAPVATETLLVPGTPQPPA